jgi:hypothetical protein
MDTGIKGGKPLSLLRLAHAYIGLPGTYHDLASRTARDELTRPQNANCRAVLYASIGAPDWKLPLEPRPF